MEIRVFPRTFGVTESTVAQADGDATATELILQDAGGTVVVAVFGPQDWQSFQRYIADPVAEAERAAARAKLLGPGGLSPSVKTKH